MIMDESMTTQESLSSLIRAARQVIQTEHLLGGDVLPTQGTPLPALATGEIPQAPGGAVAAAVGSHVSAGGDTGATDSPAPVVSSRPPKLHGDPETAARKAAALKEIADQVCACCRCGLGSSRTNAVPGEGNPDARVMFVGEGPGADEDIQGRPFVGRAGQLLDKQIAAMGLRREDVFIANVVKCRPPNNRPPTPEEAAACWPFLKRQIEIIEPEVIVALGNPAVKALLNSSVGITRLRGQWHELWGIPVMPTFHPAYLLRQYSVENRRRVWDDLQKVMERLRLPARKA
jgi:uracil-DNA glycosylase